jgi:hypothetical protein
MERAREKARSLNVVFVQSESMLAIGQLSGPMVSINGPLGCGIKHS